MQKRAMKIPKIQMVVHIFSGLALFTELMWVYPRRWTPLQVVSDREQGAFIFDLPTNECKSKYCPP